MVVINDHAGFGTFWFAHVFAKGVIYWHVLARPGLAVVGSDECCFHEAALRYASPMAFDNNMGPRYVFDMKPDVF